MQTPSRSTVKHSGETVIRPTADRAREALFSIIGKEVENVMVLDLFAGTGALGLEALSRGAREVCFVENGRVGQRLISENIAKLRVEDATSLMRNDATRLGAWPHAPFDLVFLDPPYGKGMGEKALVAARGGGWLAPGATVVWEENAPMQAPEGFTRRDTRKYGDTHVTVLEVDG